MFSGACGVLKKLIFVFVFLILFTAFSSAISVIDKLSDSSKVVIASKTYVANLSMQSNGVYIVELNNLIKTDFLPKINAKDINWKLDKTIPDLKNTLSFDSLVLQYSAEEGNDVVLTADVVFEETKVNVSITTNNFSTETFFVEQSFDFGVPFGSAFTVYTPMSRDESELLRQKILSFSDSKYGIGGNNILLKFNEFPSALIGKRGDDFVIYSPYNVKWDQKVESNRFSSLNLEFSPAYVVPQKQFWPNFIVDPNENLTQWFLIDRGVLIKKQNTENLVSLVRTIISNTTDKNEIVENVLQRLRIVPTHTKSDSLINQDIADVSVIIKSGGTKLEKAYAMREIMHAIGLPSKIIVGAYDRSREYFVAVFTDRWIYIDVARGMKISRNEFTEVFSEQEVPVYSNISDVDSVMLLIFSVVPFAIISIVLFVIIFHFRSFIPIGRKQQKMVWKEDVFHNDYVVEEKKTSVISRMVNPINTVTKKIVDISKKTSPESVQDSSNVQQSSQPVQQSSQPNELNAMDSSRINESPKVPLEQSNVPLNQPKQETPQQETNVQTEKPIQVTPPTQTPTEGSEINANVGAQYFVIRYSLGEVEYDFMEPIEDTIAKYISLNGNFDLKKCSQESGFSDELIKSTLEKMIENKSVKREKVVVNKPNN